MNRFAEISAQLACVSAAGLLGVGCGGVTPASCTPPPAPTGSPYQCYAPPRDWPGALPKVQVDAEWVEFDVKAVFNALPTPEQQRLADFTALIAKLDDVDKAFVDAVDAYVATKSGDYDGALQELEVAVVALVDRLDAVSPELMGRDEQSRVLDAKARSKRMLSEAAHR